MEITLPSGMENTLTPASASRIQGVCDKATLCDTANPLCSIRVRSREAARSLLWPKWKPRWRHIDACYVQSSAVFFFCVARGGKKRQKLRFFFATAVDWTRDPSTPTTLARPNFVDQRFQECSECAHHILSSPAPLCGAWLGCAVRVFVGPVRYVLLVFKKKNVQCACSIFGRPTCFAPCVAMVRSAREHRCMYTYNTCCCLRSLRIGLRTRTRSLMGNMFCEILLLLHCNHNSPLS